MTNRQGKGSLMWAQAYVDSHFSHRKVVGNNNYKSPDHIYKFFSHKILIESLKMGCGSEIVKFVLILFNILCMVNT